MPKNLVFEKLKDEIQITFPIKGWDKKVFNYPQEKNIFLNSNDQLYAQALSELSKRETEECNGAALVVGASALPSSLPDIKEDLIFVCDIKNGTLAFSEFLLSELPKIDFETMTDLEDRLISYDKLLQKNCPIPREQRRDDQKLISALELNELSLGDRHFIYRPKECLDELSTKTIIHVSINLFEKKQVELLSNILKKYNINISFLNMTNLHLWDRENQLVESLSTLPIKSKAYIHVSSVAVASSLLTSFASYLSMLKESYSHETDIKKTQSYECFMKSQKYYWEHNPFSIDDLKINPPMQTTLNKNPPFQSHLSSHSFLVTAQKAEARVEVKGEDDSTPVPKLFASN